MQQRLSCPLTVTSWERVHRLLRAHFADARYHSAVELVHIDLFGSLPRVVSRMGA